GVRLSNRHGYEPFASGPPAFKRKIAGLRPEGRNYPGIEPTLQRVESDGAVDRSDSTSGDSRSFMISDPLPPFEDPMLKTALRRAFREHHAPASLTRRVVQAMDEQPAPRKSILARIVPLVGLAAAAMLLIVAGTFAWGYFVPPSAPRAARPTVTLPSGLAQAIVQ